MIWTVHMIVGAAVAAKTHNPALGLFFAILSHFALDFIPHWDYYRSIGKVKDASNWTLKTFLNSIIKVGLDFLIGLLLVFLIFKNSDSLMMASMGALFAITPDISVFIFYRFKIKNRFLVRLQQFHGWCNDWYFNDKIKEQPVMLGMLSQMVVVALVIFSYL